MCLNTFLYSGFLILVCIIGIGNCLQCFKCHATVSESVTADPCQGVTTLETCQPNSLCLKTHISMQDCFSQSKRLVSAKTCYINRNGTECEELMNILNDLIISPSPRGYYVVENCTTCNKDRCNSASLVPQSALMLLFLTLCSYINCWLIPINPSINTSNLL